MPNLEELKEILEKEVKKRDSYFEVNKSNPDPILIARKYKDERVVLICSLFSYGRASSIVNFLSSLDFSILEYSEDRIKKETKKFYYRFQNGKDLANIFITLKRVLQHDSLENIFYRGYKKEDCVIDGLSELIGFLRKINSYDSRGYNFLIGKSPSKRRLNSSPYKRWNLFLRWMVRKDNIDLGLWKKVNKKDLIIPLDTHMFNVSKKIGLLNRKSYDLKAALELTLNLKKFDPDDPVKYDFAIYRIGQQNIKIFN